LDRESGAIVRGNNERFGFKKHWNTLRNPPAGYAPDWAERRIAEIDGLAATEIARLLKGDFTSDLGPLACAIAFMTHNNPRVMDELDKHHADEVAHWSEDHRLVVRLNTVIKGWREYVPTFYAVHVIDPEMCDARFLTSSNPLVDFSNKPTHLLPISSRHCLFLSHDPQHRDFSRNFLKCEREMVAGINSMTMKNAWQYVYSCTPEFSE
jgi:hypothetical protein